MDFRSSVTSCLILKFPSEGKTSEDGAFLLLISAFHKSTSIEGVPRHYSGSTDASSFSIAAGGEVVTLWETRKRVDDQL